ncbi:YjzC family protein [Jeotgalibacillus proteolyticus]|uniref:DUF2515 domain-containing protein n=1 Tax=Jeotgalibacillus proteolyticus TaxID=2082395 RepID=A0A2S5G7J1_9BACL|nr:YjzC family protein [Jeotgalibacillus proteolyticus]PPA68925.1 DUF2515 domain-containing protein [Jeotgalibacillus proteolyticus]
MKEGRGSSYTLSKEERDMIAKWKSHNQIKHKPELNEKEKELVKEINKKTSMLNQTNVTRTQAYFDFYQRHPEIHWALLAHLVSRNGGWSMTDLKGNLLEFVFSEQQKEDFFAFLEKANAFIFHDAFPQLLLYEKSKNDRQNYFKLLPFFGVSSFMEPIWHSFLNSPSSKLLTVALIINEQHYIEQRLISNSHFQKKVYESRLFRIQEFFHFNYIVFPHRNFGQTQLIGRNVSHFAPLEKRISLGKRLYAMLFSSPSLTEEITEFCASTVHSGSRADYWPDCFSKKTGKMIYSPVLENAWGKYASNFWNQEWYQNNSVFDFFNEFTIPKILDISKRYNYTLHFLRFVSALLKLKNKITKSGHTRKKLKKGGKIMGQNHQFKPGQKAPNNGYYVEIGETGSTVNDPNQIKLKAGEEFPETKNKDRVWMPKRKP